MSTFTPKADIARRLNQLGAERESVRIGSLCFGFYRNAVDTLGSPDEYGRAAR
jgi:hypothetical protein